MGKVYYNKWASSIICLFPYNIIGTVYIYIYNKV